MLKHMLKWDIKTDILNIDQLFRIAILFQEVKKNMDIMKKEVKDMKKAQLKPQKLKATISEIQNRINDINSRLDSAEENVSEFEGISIEMPFFPEGKKDCNKLTKHP